MAKPSCRVTTPTFTASFPHVFKAQSAPGFDPRFSVNMVFDEGEDLSKIEAAIEAAIEKGIADPKKFNGKRPANLELPLRDGAEQVDKDGNPRPEFAGKIFAVAAAKEDSPPAVIDKEYNAILDTKEIYGGVRLKAAVVAYPWKFGKRYGVSLHLDKVQKQADGQAFTVSATDEEDFG